MEANSLDIDSGNAAYVPTKLASSAIFLGEDIVADIERRLVIHFFLVPP